MKRILRNIAIGAAVLLAIVITGALVVVHTAWFRNYVRAHIIEAAEERTGGKVDLGSVELSVLHLRAVITDFVIHGTEPAGAPPFVSAARIEVDIRLFTSLHRIFDIAYVGIQRPQLNVIEFADGRTNIPSPEAKSTVKESPLATVVDLAIGHFDLRNGLATFDSRRQPLNMQANNVHAQLYYNLLNRGYQGQMELQPVYFVNGRNTPVILKVTLPVVLQKDRIDIRHASITTAVSALSIDGSIQDLGDPRITAHVNGHIATIDLDNAASVPLAVNAKKVPSEVDLDLNVNAARDRIDVTGLRIALGKSNIEASGPLEGPNANAALQFRSELALGELGRLLKTAELPEEVLAADGTVKMYPGGKVDLQSELGQLDIQTLTRAAGLKMRYDGLVSGSVAAQFDTHNIVVSAHLAIVPHGRGIPISGRINADYNRAADDLDLEESYIAFPHSRLTLSGSIGRRLDVLLTTRNLNDFVPGTPVSLESEARFSGAVTGSLSAPRIAGRLAVNRFSVEGRTFSGLFANVAAKRNDVEVRDAILTRGPMRVNLAANLGLRDWSVTQRAPVSANLSIADADLADATALTGEPVSGYSGALTASAHISGTLANPQGSANLQVTKGTLDGQPFNLIQAQVYLTDRLVTIPAAYVESGAGRIYLTGEFHHPRDSFTTGTVHAHLQSNRINLAQRANLAGTLQVDADVNGDLGSREFLLTSVNGEAYAQGLVVDGEKYGDASLIAKTTGSTVSYRAASDFAGSNIKVSGSTQLTRNYPTTADAVIGNLPIEKALVAARRTDIPARGVLSATAHFTGTYINPQGSADFDVSHAVIYNEALDRVHGRVTYLPQSIDLPQLEMAAGSSHVNLTAHYDHPAGNLEEGNVRFDVANSHIDIAHFRPGFGGNVNVSASGAASIHEKGPPVLLNDLNANVVATGLSAQGHNYGALKLTATTSAANRLSFALDSNLTGGSVHGRGTADLAGDYPVNAQLTFANISAAADRLEVRTDGELTVRGPALQPEQLSGAVRLSTLSITAPGTPVAIANQGPVSVDVDRGNVRIQNAHLTGQGTDIQVTGGASLKDGTLNAGVNANANLGLLQKVDSQFYSSGSIVVSATVRGTVTAPLINGRMILEKATVNYEEVPVAISNANGVIVFNGNSASIQNLTAESGGGKLNVTGFAAFAPALRFGVHAAASDVRVRFQEGVSIGASADVQWTGTPDNSVVSGTATIVQVNYAPRSDIGSILTRAAPPVQAASPALPLLQNMKLDVRVRTSSGMAVQASLAENLQAYADIRIRGTASQPGVLGRITINEGQLVFFGTEYTVDTGTISFFNPIRIEPVLDVSLQTQAQGVTVTLHVTGPIDNMKISYTSDPPLQFQEIVALLAAGTTPTSDPTILANEPSPPAQGFQQMGESAILGRALADPVATQLQRVFGLTQFRIDPAFTTGTSVPTASVTVVQRITNNLTFSYVSAINDPNGLIVRIEWDIDPRYSAVATRDQNGIFSINFFYKRQFR